MDSSWGQHVRGMVDPASAQGDGVDPLHQLLLAQIGRTPNAERTAPSTSKGTSQSFVVHRNSPPRTIGRRPSHPILSHGPRAALSMSTPNIMPVTPAHARQHFPHQSLSDHSIISNRSMSGGLNSSIREPPSSSAMNWMDRRGPLDSIQNQHAQTQQNTSPRNAPVLMRRWACSTIHRYLLRMSTSIDSSYLKPAHFISFWFFRRQWNCSCASVGPVVEDSCSRTVE